MTDSSTTASASEITTIQNYLNGNAITGTQQLSSGVFYKVNVVGTGQAIANLCTTVTVKYTGRLTTGVVFDSTAAGAVTAFQLGGVIVGWQKGLPLISKGGKITLYIPPSLGYGSAVVGIIPANSILIFDIELVDISNL